MGGGGVARKRGKIVLKQSLIHVHTPLFPTLIPMFFICSSSIQILKTILREKKYWRDICPHPPSEANGPFQSEYSRECDMVLPLSNSFP
jgi:hypothetical protein